MQYGRLVLKHAGIVVLAMILVLAGTGSAWADGRQRYEPPTSPTPTSAEDAPVTPVPESATYVDSTDDGSSNDSAPAISAPAVDEAPVPQENVRARPDSRPIELATAVPTKGPTATATATQDPATINPRLDEPVLRWLPEIMAASKDSGTPPEVIAGVMRLESGGDPNIISPSGARGQMQIMPDNLISLGVSEDLWHDPATNIMAGGRFLAQQEVSYGSWQQAVGAYFGFGCDVFGTCTETYIQVAFSWAAFYAPAIADPLNSGYALLPADWVAPPIVPFVEAAPPKVETPPATRPTPSVTPTGTAVPTGTPTDGGTAVPTPVPTQDPGTVPTEVPTAVPTVEVPTEAPTEPPVEVPTEVPVEQPTEPPVEVPTDPPTDPASTDGA